MLSRASNCLIRHFRRHLSSNRTILGIETSCDDTGIAIIRENGDILADVCSSQTALHLSNGGIIPPVARDMHRQAIDRCVSDALDNAGLKATQLDAIAVTVMPGLSLSLAIGVLYAKKLSAKYDLPVIPIHHMQAHALTAMLQYPALQFPFVTMLISGGHCLIAYVHSLEDFRLLGTTIDIAPGDILDKIARLLRLKNLGEPFNRIAGGAAIELAAKTGNPLAYFEKASTHALYRRRTCNFSFSGFMTYVCRTIERLEMEENIPPNAVLPQAPDICASILFVLSFTFIKRLQRAFDYLDDQSILPEHGPRKLVMSGGCAANRFIISMISQYCKEHTIDLFVPPARLCTDNGLMVAWNGALKLRQSSADVLRDQNTIQALDYSSKACIGIDLTELVTNSNIKTDSINAKLYLQSIS